MAKSKMKKYLFHFFFILIYSNTFSQLNDNIWPLASDYGPNSIYYYNLDFSLGQPDTFVYQRKMFFFNTNSAVCDSIGNLQFYTNGIWVANKVHDTLFNSQNFNPGWATNYYQNSGMGFSQSAIILPFSDSSKFYYLIYESAENFYNSDNAYDVQPFHLSYSVVDMYLDNNNGGVTVLKDIRPIQDTLLLGRITACKHANGRDWWIVVHKYYSDLYYTLLFTPSGVFGPYTQQIGPILNPKLNGGGDYDVIGMAIFSPDGTKYAMVGTNNLIEFLNFDRCTGQLSNYQSIQIIDTNAFSLSCAFSPNSRYLYANSLLNAFQFDTYASNIDSSAILIAHYDGFLNPFQTWFFLNQLGPDGKIYLGTYNGSYILHVIENPDSLGLACNFNQHGFILPNNYGGNYSVPNFPNYRLGRLIGSPCDTLTSLTPYPSPKERGVVIAPNPLTTQSKLTFSNPHKEKFLFTLYDITGRVTETVSTTTEQIILTKGSKQAGVYLFHFDKLSETTNEKTGERMNGKIIMQ